MSTPAQTSTPAHLSTPSDREIRAERIFNASPSRVWRALTEPSQLARWWCRGNPMVVERFALERGGHWRFVEHSPDGIHGFEGRFRRVEPPHVLEQTFEWDGAPGHVAVERTTLEDLGDGRTRLVTVSLFHTAEDRDAMLNAGMEDGMNQSYAALDRLLAGSAEGNSAAADATQGVAAG